MICDWTFFAFPLNLLLASLWIVGWSWLYRRHRESSLIRFMLSPLSTILSISLLLAACFWIGLSGNREFVGSLVFVMLLLFIQTVLFLVILRGWRRSDCVIRWRFIMLHAGLLLALGAGYWGAPDSYELRVALDKGQAVREAYRLDGQKDGLSYELKLIGCEARYSIGNKPIHYEAIVSADDSEPVKITVNHPYNVRIGEDIYLTSVSDNGCVLQIVHEPWRYLGLVGILMLMAGAVMLFLKGPRK